MAARTNLSERVRFERRTTASDGAGNVMGGWERIGPAVNRAQINELRGDETVLAAKLQGHALCVVVIRASELSRSLTTDDRIVQLIGATGERVLNIRHAPQIERGLFRSLICEDGVA